METDNFFIAINHITADKDYVERFESLFKDRAHLIDGSTGFQKMYVLKPTDPQDPYLIISHWDSEEHFKLWHKSPAFSEGHRRGFEDMKNAHNEGRQMPMSSTFKTYTLLAR